MNRGESQITGRKHRVEQDQGYSKRCRSYLPAGLVFYFLGELIMKNRVHITVIIVSVVLAGLIFYMTHSASPGGIENLKHGELMWVMCNNPDCGEVYQIDKKDYFLQIEERMRVHPMSLQTLPLVCEKCGQESVFRAEKCGKIFFSGAVSNDFSDRCPECGYSKTEAIRKARTATRDD